MCLIYAKINVSAVFPPCFFASSRWVVGVIFGRAATRPRWNLTWVHGPSPRARLIIGRREPRLGWRSHRVGHEARLVADERSQAFSLICIERNDGLGSVKPESAILFGLDYHRWPAGAADYLFGRACAEVGIEGLTPHGLRHTTASLAISAGANVKVVQRMLGHATAAMTLDRYGHLFDDDLAGVADALGKAIKSTAVSLRYEETKAVKAG